MVDEDSTDVSEVSHVMFERELVRELSEAQWAAECRLTREGSTSTGFSSFFT